MSATADRLEQANPRAYQDKLLNLLGQRAFLEVLGETPGVLRALVQETPAARLRQRPFPGKWTPNEVIGHLMDAEWVLGYRSRTILCDDRPQIVPMDQDLWVATQQHNEREPTDLVNTFAALRGANLTLWRRLTPKQLERYGRHAERGEESLNLMLRMYAGHDLSHLDQIRRYLEAIPA